MTTEYLGAFTVPDGYFGATSTAHAVFDPETHKIVHVYPFGTFRCPFLTMDIQDADEARWLIANHPNGRKYYH